MSVPRVVLDTNLLISALLFIQGKLTPLRQAWQTQQILPLASKVTITELMRVLAYPKFKLTPAEQGELLADYLPFCVTVSMPAQLPAIPSCRDPNDAPFLHLAIVGEASYLVTGDRDLLTLADSFLCPIITAADLFALLSLKP